MQRVAAQLAGQERKTRQELLKGHRSEREDEVYKSYGVLKYARKLSMKEGMIYLSQVRGGIYDGVIRQHLQPDAGHPAGESAADDGRF